MCELQGEGIYANDVTYRGVVLCLYSDSCRLFLGGEGPSAYFCNCFDSYYKD